VTLTLGVAGLFFQGNGLSTCWQITQEALARSHVALSAAEGPELHRAQNVSGAVRRLVGKDFRLFGKLRVTLTLGVGGLRAPLLNPRPFPPCYNLPGKPDTTITALNQK